jgi:hypothetical protein
MIIVGLTIRHRDPTFFGLAEKHPTHPTLADHMSEY